MDGWDLMVLLTLQYPQYKAIVDKPGVFDVLQQALSADVPWTKDRIDAALANTPYFLNTPKEYRDWDINAAIDPATAGQKYQAAQLQLRDVMTQVGFHLEGELPFDPFHPNINLFGPPTPYSEFLKDALAMGWDAKDMKYALMLRGQGISGGELTTNVSRVMKLADDYGVPLSIEQAGKWGSQLTGGVVDMNGITGYMQEQAKSLFPGLTDALSRGITVRQYADPYLQIAQKELGTNPDTVSLTDPKWMAALNQIDPKTGARVSMNLADWTSHIRTDPTYGYDSTMQAQQESSSLATKLAHMMGATG